MRKEGGWRGGEGKEEVKENDIKQTESINK